MMGGGGMSGGGMQEGAAGFGSPLFGGGSGRYGGPATLSPGQQQLSGMLLGGGGFDPISGGSGMATSGGSPTQGGYNPYGGGFWGGPSFGSGFSGGYSPWYGGGYGSGYNPWGGGFSLNSGGFFGGGFPYQGLQQGQQPSMANQYMTQQLQPFLGDGGVATSTA